MTEVYTAAPGYVALRRHLAEQKERYGSQIRLFSIGHSTLGRSIYAVGVGEIRGCTLFVGGIGGQEWQTTLLLLRFFDALMTCLKEGGRIASIDVRRAMEGRSLMILPCLNPDGIELAAYGASSAGVMSAATEQLSRGCYNDWQANARGVDLRCAFDAGWMYKGEPSAAGFSGTRPMSEPECRAAANFSRAFEVRRLFVFSNGPREISYRFAQRPTPRARLIAQVLANCSGCRVTDRAASAGFKDWFIQTFNSLAFEVGIDAADDPEETFCAFAEMMILALLI